MIPFEPFWVFWLQILRNWHLDTTKKHTFLTKKGQNGCREGSEQARLLPNTGFYICTDESLPLYICEGTFSHHPPHKTFASRSEEQRGNWGETVVWLHPGCLATSSDRSRLAASPPRKSQNSWHHPTGSREFLLQGETWARKICFDPNGAAGRCFQVSELALKGEKDVAAFVMCKSHNKMLDLHMEILQEWWTQNIEYKVRFLLVKSTHMWPCMTWDEIWGQVMSQNSWTPHLVFSRSV